MAYSDKAAVVGRIPVQFVELDMDYCANTYGSSPCTAAVGVTGAQKCFNTYATCQDKAHYVKTTKTYRFCERNAALPVGIQALPLLDSVTFASQQLTPGKGLGVRASVTVRLSDMPHHDAGIDPYVSTRSYVPENQGTFWGKFRARNKFYQARAMRVLTGYIGASFSWGDFETRAYILDSFKGPNRDGTVELLGKDILKLADDKKAMCPVPNSGTLLNDITAAATSCALSPTGIGDLEYPSGSFRIVISGEGIDCSRTAGSDTLTFSARDVYGTQSGGKAHQAGDTVQVVKRFSSKYIDEVIADLLLNYANVPSSWIDTTAWAAERTSFLPGVWSTDICEPVGVNTLLSELTEQGLCDIWSDEVAQQIRFQALRPLSIGLPTLTDEEHFLERSVNVYDDPSQRISRVLVYYGRIDPTRKLDEPSNYRGRYISGDFPSETSNEYGTAAIKTIMSRWFSNTSLGRVETLVDTLTLRFSIPPRKMDFKLDASKASRVGDLFRASTRFMQDETGARALVSMMVVESKEEKAGSIFACRAQEAVYNERILSSSQRLVISVSTLDTNLYDAYVVENGVPTSALTLEIHILPGVVLGSSSTSTPAVLNPSSWPAGSVITLINAGTISGMGGAAGAGGSMSNGNGASYIAAGSGGAGGTAFKTTYPITIDNSAGVIQGGGGGGGGGAANTTAYGQDAGGGGGGGGAGSNAGSGAAGGNGGRGWIGASGAAGTLSAGGAGGAGSHNSGGVATSGGNGGAPGTAGGTAASAGGHAGGAGGAAGKAVEGNSNITWTATGTRTGAIT